jgi:general secretion pathway protein M
MRLSKNTVKQVGSNPDQQRPYQLKYKRLQQSWETLEPREQNFVLTALLTVAVALLWFVAISPALGVLSTADVLQNSLDSQLQQMRVLQSEAKSLQGQNKVTGAAAAQALEASAKERFGASAQVVLSGSKATLTLRGASGDSLAQWLSQARLIAKALPVQAQLRRVGVDPATWEGTLVLSVPVQ